MPFIKESNFKAGANKSRTKALVSLPIECRMESNLIMTAATRKGAIVVVLAVVSSLVAWLALDGPGTPQRASEADVKEERPSGRAGAKTGLAPSVEHRPLADFHEALQPLEILSQGSVTATNGGISRRVVISTSGLFGRVLAIDTSDKGREEELSYYSAEHIVVNAKSEEDHAPLLKLFEEDDLAARKPFRYSRFLYVSVDMTAPNEIFELLKRVSALVGESGTVELDRIGFAMETVPDDPFFDKQWHHGKIQSSKAWDISRGDESVVVAVVDTGVFPDLIELEGRLAPGFNLIHEAGVEDEEEPVDDAGHGTAIAGVIAARVNNDRLVAGVDWRCKIMPIRIALAGGSTGSAVAAGIDRAVESGAKVINVSWGLDRSISLVDSVENAANHGCVVIAAAGNEGHDVPGFPAAIPQAIAVGATGRDDSRASWSSWGEHIDLVAPGIDIISLGENNQQSTGSGTSLSCPQVAAAAALLLSVNPDLGWREVKALLAAGAEDMVGDELDTPGRDPYYGWGRLNIYNSLILAVVPTEVSRESGERVKVSWTTPENVLGRSKYHVEHSGDMVNWSEANSSSIILSEGKGEWIDDLSDSSSFPFDGERFYRVWAEPLVGIE